MDQIVGKQLLLADMLSRAPTSSRAGDVSSDDVEVHADNTTRVRTGPSGDITRQKITQHLAGRGDWTGPRHHEALPDQSPRRTAAAARNRGHGSSAFKRGLDKQS
ncbi:uncharacterized protein LOC125942923 isoform X2 [Dermacentor silvarum]|uniref:uncharacterized protein LOC125942923 isoform X2 n=1 Tax=Dermacentor silvarum TaxID=543639 RepID=UPI0021008465|nr:uncharacterized protein LOC125942923 isoform X2 [Dermacentor silvarum]